MILEGILTTVSDSGKINLTPMGPRFVEGDDHFELRPFETSTTYRNLVQNPCGVLHITDDIGLFVHSAINKLETLPPMENAERVNGFVLKDCCRWFEFDVVENEVEGPRKSFGCKILNSSQGQREFYGFNRARHAILEATILATRVAILPRDEILDQFKPLETIVNKTGGAAELELFKMLCEYVSKYPLVKEHS